MEYVSEGSRSNLASYLVGRLAAGRLVFSREEAQAALGISRGAFLDAAEKLQKRDRLLNLRHGFYVIVPPQHLNFGSPPPASFIDDLMRHENRPYYVGLLKAAELQGASHQAVMEFQVVTNRQMRDVQSGRSKIAFYFRKDMSAIASGIQERKTDTGKMKISSVELTLLDLVRYPQASAGLDNILTVFWDLGPKLNPESMEVLSHAFERSVIQRAGYLLDLSGFAEHADKLHTLIQRRSRIPWVELEPSLLSDPDLTPEVQARDERWHVLVRRIPERDE
jgi:predicted transcriptional regulator of viral defense system